MNFKWNMPVDWCHSGLPLGNGLFGALVWGDRQTLKITFNRADYWFHGANLPPDQEQSYDNLKRCLAVGNELEMKRIFAGFKDGVRPLSSSRLPMGRLDVDLPQVLDGELELDIQSATGTFTAENSDLTVHCAVPRGLPLLALSLSGCDRNDCIFHSSPADAEDIREFYKKNGFPELRLNDAHDNLSGGWEQGVPGGKTLCVYWRVCETEENTQELFLAAALESAPEQAMEAAIAMVDNAVAQGFAAIAAETAEWWNQYWERTPRIEFPDREINEIYQLGMYRLGGSCAPDAPSLTLQGPWVEDYRMPPWGSDYHFNINVQECYWPVFAGNVPEFILPLFEMLKSWEPRLREYARCFTGIENGLMLPHATDDQGMGMGGFWPGHIDHSCTAWMAQLMWLYWKYTQDNEFRDETLYPFMLAALNVYDAMLEEDMDGKLFLAAESSPEYNENRINAWGRNPSIHLAAIHFLANSLIELVEIRGIDEANLSRWQSIVANLPRFSLTSKGTIGIWDGQALEEPHRHFSHLAALHPFDLLDWRNSAADKELLDKSICEWITRGTGLWSGWSFPWASIIYSRLEMPEAAHTMLSIFRRAFMKDDYALRYLPERVCFTAVAGPTASLIMQLEAGMAATAAVMEMCVHCSRGVIYPFAGIPDYWKDLSFDGIRTEGAFLIGGRKENGIVSELTITALHDGKMKIKAPPGNFIVFRNGVKVTSISRQIYETDMAGGERIILSTPNDGNRFSLVDEDHRWILSRRLAEIIPGEG